MTAKEIIFLYLADRSIYNILAIPSVLYSKNINDSSIYDSFSSCLIILFVIFLEGRGIDTYSAVFNTVISCINIHFLVFLNNNCFSISNCSISISIANFSSFFLLFYFSFSWCYTITNIFSIPLNNIINNIDLENWVPDNPYYYLTDIGNNTDFLLFPDILLLLRRLANYCFKNGNIRNIFQFSYYQTNQKYNIEFEMNSITGYYLANYEIITERIKI